ncbi:hypothetical protein X929_01240 [Petrotoga olearia DSM 13574]|uniref:Uncharacterized protein n=1 Tax=Petrotoga olearia DSM 13574 TaxID=1122955 RepID=A0A2K1P5Q8_9BACT|nr:hypothetical protein X929_01240 [Petrotoga olearia DSM 13574]
MRMCKHIERVRDKNERAANRFKMRQSLVISGFERGEPLFPISYIGTRTARGI